MSDCTFCKIVAGDIPAKILRQDEQALVVRDVNPQAPVHVLVVPRRHVASLDATAADDAALLGHLLLEAKAVAAAEGIGGAYRVVVNCGAAAGQSVFHLHLHVLGGRNMGWPPG